MDVMLAETRKPFEKDPEIEEAVVTLLGRCRELVRGDVLTREEVAAAARAEPHESRYKTVVDALRDALREDRGIALRAVVGEGYRLLTVDAQTIVCTQDGLRQSRRALRRAARNVDAIPAAECTHSQSVRRAAMARILGDAVRAVRAQERTTCRLLAPVKVVDPGAG